MSQIDYRKPTDHPLPITEAIGEIIAALRKQVLSQLVSELMEALAAEGYYLDELVDSLADYADTRSEWDEGCKRLEEAAEAFLNVRKPLRHPPTPEGESAV